MSLVVCFIIAAAPVRAEAAPKLATENPTKDNADFDQLVEKVQSDSLKLREKALRKSIATNICWPGGAWGDCLWCLSALYLNEKTDEANERLLKAAKDYLSTDPKTAPLTTPEKGPKNLPWTFFSANDYVRILCLFHAKSSFFPGRLKADTEAAMKEALWCWVSGESRIADLGADDLFLLLGTENHDLNRRPAYYLALAMLQDDPAYKGRKLKDGHTVEEHVAAYTAFFREWPRRRAQSGLWVEIGSNVYQKYSWPGLFNLHELSPDPIIRKRFGLLLDLAFVEEEQISVHGKRGGGKSRAYYDMGNSFQGYKNLLYAQQSQPAGSSHSRVFETSRYQLPPEAIYLRYLEFPAEKPFVIRNRLLGEVESHQPAGEFGQRIAASSALVNYAYRTPHYLLGSALQDPTHDYMGISQQSRTCGMLFDDPASPEICSVDVFAERGSRGKPQHAFWSVQQENVLILQRIAPDKLRGSYSAEAVGVAFTGPALKKVEKNGWIFADNGKAFIAVKFLDGAYQWDQKGQVPTPQNSDEDSNEDKNPPTSTRPATAIAKPADFASDKDQSRILIHAGDIASDESFEKFQTAVLANELKVSNTRVDYRWGKTGNRLQVELYNPKKPQQFSLPLVNGKSVDLRPVEVYQSPYLNGAFGGDTFTVSVGPIKRLLDFSK